MKFVDNSTIENTSGQQTQVTDCECECATYKTLDLPCGHMFAIKQANSLSLYCPDIIPERLTNGYAMYTEFLPLPELPEDNGVVLSHKTPKKKLKTENERFKAASKTPMYLASTIAQIVMKLLMIAM